MDVCELDRNSTKLEFLGFNLYTEELTIIFRRKEGRSKWNEREDTQRSL